MFDYVFQLTQVDWNVSPIATYSLFEIYADYFRMPGQDLQYQAPVSRLSVLGSFTADFVRDPDSDMGSFNQAFGLGTAVLSLVTGGSAKTLGILSCGGVPS